MGEGVAIFDTLLRTTAAWVSALMAISAGVGAVIYGLWRRVRVVSDASAREAVEPLAEPLAEAVRRLEKVEAETHRVVKDVSNLRTAQTVLDRRIGRIETALEGVSRKEDLAALGSDFAEFRGSASAELRQINSLVQSINLAILRAGEARR